jgi:hypothetical protein
MSGPPPIMGNMSHELLSPLRYLQACMRTASHPRYVVIFSSENMTYGPWVALFSAYWASGSLLGIPAGSDGLRQVTT